MASKDILKHNGNTVPTINDSANSPFGGFEVYSREKVDALLKALQMHSGHDWSGKKITFEGESLTGNATMGYPAYVAEQTGATAKNIAISGKMIYPNAAGSFEDFRRRVSNIPADTDAIIIMGDCNSKYEARVDNVDDYYKYDAMTWAGRWNIALRAIKKSFPTVPVFLVSQWVSENDSKYAIEYIKTYVEGFWRFANRHGLILVNLATESPLSLSYAYSVWGLTATDRIHTNHEAMPLFADVIIRHLKQIPPPVWKGSDTLTLTTTQLTVAAGATAEIEYAITGDLSVQWTSDNMDVACVMGGVVYGMAAGEAVITCTTRNGNNATCRVTVTG
jgi:hypothetical protein